MYAKAIGRSMWNTMDKNEEITLELFLENKCNNKCIFCYYTDKELAAKKYLSLEEIKGRIKQIRKETDSIVFNGGEPTLRKDLPDVIKYAKSQGFKKIKLLSNGRLLYYKSYCKKLINSGITDFIISIQSSIPRIHDLLSQVNGSFSQTIKAIKNLKSLKATVIPSTVISKFNYKDIPELTTLLISLKVPEINFCFVRPTGRAYENKADLLIKIEDLKPCLEQVLDICNDDNTKVFFDGYPFCTLPKRFHNHLLKAYQKENIPESIKTHLINRFDLTRKKQGFCAECIMNKKCVGPWKEYLEIFGSKEFKPIK